MTSLDEQIAKIEKEIRDTPYHKATEHHIGKLRAKLSKLKEKDLDSGSKKGGGKGGYAVKKQGDATVVLVGPPSAGKSTLINKLTNANSKVAAYSFTTVTVIPGIMEYKDARIQLLDVPGLIEGAEEGKGRGREVLSVIRGSNLLIIMSDTKRPGAFKSMLKALERNGIRINKKSPEVRIEKRMSGGINVISNAKQPFSKETVKEIAKEFRITNADITIKEKLTIDKLIDTFSKSRVYIPAILVLNKIDVSVPSRTLLREAEMEAGRPARRDLVEISAEKNINLEILRKKIWKKLGFVRVYLVKGDEGPTKNNPLIMLEGDSLEDVAEKIGKEFAEGKSRAKIWGAGAKFPEQLVSLTKKVQEDMQVRFV